MKKKTLLFLFAISFIGLKAQVNLQTGSPQISIPILSYANDKSNLNLNISLNYNGGNGIKVNDEATEVGLGWSLFTGGQVVRFAIDEPDDQIQKDIPGFIDDYHIRAGIFFPPSTYDRIDKNAWAPTYSGGNAKTFYSPGVHYDKEHDEFVFNFNGNYGKFLLGTDVLRTPLLFEQSGLKIKTIEIPPTGPFVGSIAGFLITDENGIEYKFQNSLLSEVLSFARSEYVYKNGNNYDVAVDDYSNLPRNVIPWNYDYVTRDRQFEIFVPKKTGYYISHLWNISEIKNPLTNEKITFNYYPLEYEANKNITGSATRTSTDFDTERFMLNITENYESSIVPILYSIDLPNDKKVEFLYNNPRKDQIGKKSLDEIIYYENGIQISKHKLNYNYFYKSSILNETSLPANHRSKDVALCLMDITKVGNDGISEPPVKFDYYTGIPNDPIITFRERFNLSQDYWGYNNYDGNFSAQVTGFGSQISMPGLFEYLDEPQNHRIPSTNTELLQIGMIKEMRNSYGGVTNYEYEPNMAYYNGSNTPSGGIRVKNIILNDLDHNTIRKKTYSYLNENGLSSGYGFEMPNFNEFGDALWITPNFNVYKNYVPVLKSLLRATLPKNSVSSKVFGSGTAIVGNIVDFVNFAKSGEAAKSITLNNGIGVLVGIYFPYVGLAYSVYSAFKSTGLFSTSSATYRRLVTTTRRMNFVTNNNYIPPVYSRLEESLSGSSNNSGFIYSGKTIYEFRSNQERPFLIPSLTFPYSNKQRKLDWAYGLAKKTTQFSQAGKKISEKEYVYDITDFPVLDSKYASGKFGSTRVLISPNDPNNGYDFLSYSGELNGYPIIDTYYPTVGKTYLKKTIERVYDPSGTNYSETENNFEYNSTNFLPNYSKSTDSKNRIIESKTYFTTDYTIPGVLNSMVEKNIIATPVSTEIWQTRPGSSPEMLSASVTEFAAAPNGDYKPKKIYRLESIEPVLQNTIGVFNPNQLIRDANLILPQTEITYNTEGNLVQLKDAQANRNNSILFGYNNSIPVVSVNNATIDDVAYTSFELDDIALNSFQWNWHNNSDYTTSNEAPTGRRYSIGRVHTDIISYKNKTYKLSFWAKGNNFIITPQILLTQNITGPTINGWKYYEYEVAATNSYYTLTVDGNGSGIDELRLYPKNAGMVTTTYDQSIGKTSECDINNRITYFEYDGLGRISKVLDERRNVIKTYEYHFKN